MKRKREGQPCESISPPMGHKRLEQLSKSEIRELVSQEVLAAVKQSHGMTKTLMSRIKELEEEPKYDARVKKLEAQIKKVKRRGDAVFSYVRKLRSMGFSITQSQVEKTPSSPSPGSPSRLSDSPDLDPVVLERYRTAADGCTARDVPEPSTENDFLMLPVTVQRDGLWQSLLSKRQFVNLTEENGDTDVACTSNGEGHVEATKEPPSTTTGHTKETKEISLEPSETSCQPATAIKDEPTEAPCSEGDKDTDPGSIVLQNFQESSGDAMKPAAALSKQNTSNTATTSQDSPAQRLPSAPADQKGAWQGRLPPLPHSPFPTELPAVAATKNLPQKLVVKVARIKSSGAIGLLWSGEGQDPHAPDMDSYHVYSAQEKSDGTFTPWRTIGVIKAMSLPMACTLNIKTGSRRLCFAVVGKDVFQRFGPYSEIQTVRFSSDAEPQRV